MRGTDEKELPELVGRHADLDLPMEWFLKECPRTEVFVPAFMITRTPVTNAQWRYFAQEFETHWQPVGGPEHPVIGLSWQRASAFCDWLAQACFVLAAATVLYSIAAATCEFTVELVDP